MRISDWSSDVCSSDLLMSPVYSWLMTERAILARLLSGGTSSSGFLKIVILALSHALKVASDACWIASIGAICLRRSEERRVGKEGVRTFSSRWVPYH